MENEIKVGEYVRTIDGYIGKKVKDGLRSGTIEIEDNICSWITDICVVSKHSSNPIDIIEKRRLCKWKRSNRNKRMEIFKRWLF